MFDFDSKVSRDFTTGLCISVCKRCRKDERCWKGELKMNVVSHHVSWVSRLSWLAICPGLACHALCGWDHRVGRLVSAAANRFHRK